MSHLHRFIFDIVIEDVMINGQTKPSLNDTQRTFIQVGHLTDCYIDCLYNGKGRCHVYSVSFTMERIHPIMHRFPGGMFVFYVRTIIFTLSKRHSLLEFLVPFHYSPILHYIT